jgi:hypothetical protein
LQLPCPHVLLLSSMTNSSEFARIQIELMNLSTLLYALPIDLPTGYNFLGFQVQDHFSDDDTDDLGAGPSTPPIPRVSISIAV